MPLKGANFTSFQSFFSKWKWQNTSFQGKNQCQCEQTEKHEIHDVHTEKPTHYNIHVAEAQSSCV